MMEREIEHSEWRIRQVTIAGKQMHQVYRLIDKNRVNAEGNRETRDGYYERFFDAEKLAATLNAEERK